MPLSRVNKALRKLRVMGLKCKPSEIYEMSIWVSIHKRDKLTLRKFNKLGLQLPNGTILSSSSANSQVQNHCKFFIVLDDSPGGTHNRKILFNNEQTTTATIRRKAQMG